MSRREGATTPNKNDRQ
jgi:hypothetical protein